MKGNEEEKNGYTLYIIYARTKEKKRKIRGKKKSG